MDANKKQTGNKGIKEMTQFEKESKAAAVKFFNESINAISSGHSHASNRDSAASFGKMAGFSDSKIMAAMIGAGSDAQDAKGAVASA